MVNKIPNFLDNPIDVQLYRLIDIMTPILNKYNLTPNHITGVSLVFGVSASYFLYYDKYLLSALTWFLAYYFDCVDGKLARQYNMVTKFGDYFDHSSDTFKMILLIYIMYLKLKGKRMSKLLILIFALIIINLMLVGSQFGCQEKITKDIKKNNKKNNKKDNKKEEEEDSETLAFTERLIITDCYTQMNYTKYFGSGTVIVAISLLLLFWKEITKSKW
jgi:phosphatidylglycerophosphate synthase